MSHSLKVPYMVHLLHVYCTEYRTSFFLREREGVSEGLGRAEGAYLKGVLIQNFKP